MGRSLWLCTFVGTCIRQHSGCIQIACYMDSVRPLCVSMLLYSICVCSTEGVNELDRMVYCPRVVTFLGDSGAKRAEITVVPGWIPCLIEYIEYMLHFGSARRGFSYHFLFQRRQISTVLLRGVLGDIFLSRTCSHLFPQSVQRLQFFFFCMSFYVIHHHLPKKADPVSGCLLP